MKSIAIDFGGNRIKLALLCNGEIIKKGSIPAFSENGLAPRLAETERVVRAMLEGEDKGEYAGVGVAMPGIVDPVGKKVLALYNKYEDSKTMDLTAWCEKAFGLPMVMEMDSKLALLGELNYGCGKGYKDAAMLIFGTGVGTAVAIDGKILTSRNYVAGALSSHMIIDINGRKCTCPGTGCLEASACGWALPDLVREHPGFAESGLFSEAEIDFAALERWYEKGDKTACDIVRHCVRSWRAGILNMIHAYDPALVILSGGVMKFTGMFGMLADNLAGKIWDCCGKVDIKPAGCPEDSVLLGLHYLVESGAKQ